MEAGAWASAGSGVGETGAGKEARRAERGEGFLRTFADLGDPARRLVERFLDGGGAGRGDADADADAGMRASAVRILGAFGSGRGRVPVAGKIAAQPVSVVSAREMDVLSLLAEGMGNKEIADRLFISEGTVKTHVHHLAEKLDAKSRGAIVMRARNSGLLR